MKINKRDYFVFVAVILLAFFNNCGRFQTTDSFSPGFAQQNLNTSADNSSQQSTPESTPQAPQPIPQSPQPTNPEPMPPVAQPNPQPQMLPVNTSKWINEPAGSKVHYDCGFDDDLCGMTNIYNTVSYETVLGDKALKVFLPASTTVLHQNGQWGLGFDKQKQIYIGFEWSTNSNFVGSANNFNKMIFVTSSNVSEGARENSIFGWYGGPGQAKTLLWYQQSEVDNCQVSGFITDLATNTCVRPGRVGVFSPNKNRAAATVGAASGKHRIEIYMKSSSTNSSQDGIIRHWVDGVMTSDFNNVNLASEGFNYIDISPVWDGGLLQQCNIRDCSKEWDHYFHSLHVSFPK